MTKIEVAAAKYANDYDGMQWEKDRIEIAFLAGARAVDRELLFDAFKEGFKSTGEGYNFEYPFDSEENEYFLTHLRQLFNDKYPINEVDK